MRFIILIIFIMVSAIFFSSCSLNEDYELNQFIGMTPYEIDTWIDNNIEFKKDILIDQWQLPSTTLRKRTGDCEDKSILFLYLCKLNGYGEGRLIVWKTIYPLKFHATGRLPRNDTKWSEYEFGYTGSSAQDYCTEELISYSYDVAMGIAIFKSEEGQYER